MLDNLLAIRDKLPLPVRPTAVVCLRGDWEALKNQFPLADAKDASAPAFPAAGLFDIPVHACDSVFEAADLARRLGERGQEVILIRPDGGPALKDLLDGLIDEANAELRRKS